MKYWEVSMNKFLVPSIAATLLLLTTQVMAEKSQLSPTDKSNNQTATTRIVGGEEAVEEDWPWMTAYVFVDRPLETNISVDNIAYASTSFTQSPLGNATGEVVDCNLAEQSCENAQNKICLIERGQITFSEKAINCEAGGGIGVIIYNNEPGDISGTLGENFLGSIPVVAVSQNDGVAILTQVGTMATLSVALSTMQIQQDATCGATFLGDKWVLTAAHCVDSPNAFRFKMNVGEYDLSNGAENAIDIANIYIHPNYDADAINNDIAIVELVSSVDAEAVKIAEPSITDQFAADNSIATVAGWGGRQGYAPDEGPTSDFPDVLHQVDLQLSSNEQCKETLAQTFETSVNNTGVTDVMICAAIPEGGKGSCQGDSGGPLVVNTSTGVQQVGIVSWGFGCAAAGYPGVYTRVSEFKEWLDTISNGVAIDQMYDFGRVPRGVISIFELRVANNSTESTDVSFDIEGDSQFSLNTNNCGNLAANTSCQLIVSYSPTFAGSHTAQVLINSDNPNVKASQSLLQGTAFDTANELAGVAGPTNNNLSWFSGGDRPWVVNAIGGVESGAISDRQESVLIALVDGEGTLTFDWGVSSEENTEEGEDPFDTLDFYVNNQLVDFISGEVDVAAYVDTSGFLELEAGLNIISWVYNKDPADPADLDVEDKGFVRNVVFTPVVVTPPPAPIPVTPTRSNSSGGGSLGWIMLCLFGLTFRLRNKA